MNSTAGSNLKPRAVLQQIVNERGKQLRMLPFAELALLIKPLVEGPIESLTIASRAATIGIIVEPRADGTIRVVVQGFTKARFLGKDVALDGFYKHPDGSVTPMPNIEFYEFD